MKTKKLALFTPAGLVGQSIATAALRKGHNVTAIVSNIIEFNIGHPNLAIEAGDAGRKEDVSRYAKGKDVVIYVHELKPGINGEYLHTTNSILKGMKEAGVTRVIFAGYVKHLTYELAKKESNAWQVTHAKQLAVFDLLQQEQGIQWNFYYYPYGQMEENTEALLNEVEKMESAETELKSTTLV